MATDPSVAELLHQPWYPQAPALPGPTGEVIRAANVGELLDAARRVKAGGTILIADGHYMLPHLLDIHTDGVTVRGESGAPEKVILDGAASRHIELFSFTGCRDVTAADLTIRNIRCNGFKINSDKGTHAVTIHNCVIHNIWQRGVKGVRGVVKDEQGFTHPVMDCRVQYCLFYNDRRKRYADDSYETENPYNFGGNYIGGMDVMRAKGWTIRDNVFVGIHGRTGEARGAIFIWNDSQDCLIERNIIIDCDKGICMGNQHRGLEPIHGTRMLVRNNLLARCHATGILACYTRDCRIYHNTIHDPAHPAGNGIRIERDAEGLDCRHNIVDGLPIGVAMGMTTEKGATRIADNLEGSGRVEFVDAARGNLRLAARPAEAVAPVRLADVPEDIDGTPRGERPTMGAHERTSE